MTVSFSCTQVSSPARTEHGTRAGGPHAPAATTMQATSCFVRASSITSHTDIGPDLITAVVRPECSSWRLYSQFVHWCGSFSTPRGALDALLNPKIPLRLAAAAWGASAGAPAPDPPPLCVLPALPQCGHACAMPRAQCRRNLAAVCSSWPAVAAAAATGCHQSITSAMLTNSPLCRPCQSLPCSEARQLRREAQQLREAEGVAVSRAREAQAQLRALQDNEASLHRLLLLCALPCPVHMSSWLGWNLRSHRRDFQGRHL